MIKRLTSNPVALILLCYLVLLLIAVIANRSLIFEYGVLSRVGDQRLYYDLALSLSRFAPEISQFTIGYPLFYVPFIWLTGMQPHWESIMPLVIFAQAFVVVPLTLYWVLSNKRLRTASLTVLILALLYLFYSSSTDPLTQHNFLGLVPLSEPLVSLLLVGIYKLYLDHKNKIYTPYVIGGLIAFALMTRQTSAILIAPLFIELFLSKNFRYLVKVLFSSFIFYTPQIVYNLAVSGQLYFDGYGWWAAKRMARNSELKENVFGFADSAMFSLRYLAAASTLLIARYIPFVLIIFALIAVRVNRVNRLSSLVILFSALNLLFHLSYWWSSVGSLIDRFLLPNIFLLLFFFGNKSLLLGDSEDQT